MQLTTVEPGAAATATAAPRPNGRFCDTCRAFVTTLGRTEGVLCGESSCPFKRVNWGVPSARIDPPPQQAKA